MASAAVTSRLERIGQGVLSASQGLAALASALRALPAAPLCQPPLMCVNPFAWAAYLAHLPTVPPLYSEQQDEVVALGAAAAPAAGGGAPAAVTGAGVAVNREAVSSVVAGVLEEVLGARLRPDEPLMSGEGLGLLRTLHCPKP
jgi:hypothetical protein